MCACVYSRTLSFASAAPALPYTIYIQPQSALYIFPLASF